MRRIDVVLAAAGLLFALAGEARSQTFLPWTVQISANEVPTGHTPERDLYESKYGATDVQVRVQTGLGVGVAWSYNHYVQARVDAAQMNHTVSGSAPSGPFEVDYEQTVVFAGGRFHYPFFGVGRYTLLWFFGEAGVGVTQSQAQAMNPPTGFSPPPSNETSLAWGLGFEVGNRIVYQRDSGWSLAAGIREYETKTTSGHVWFSVNYNFR